MGASGTVTRSTLRQQIADALRDEVLAGRLQQGREFTVRQIAEQYGVSATPVREALFDLSAQGLLESDQHRGFRVHEFTVADYRAMVEARTLVMDGVIRDIFSGPPPSRAQAAKYRESLISVRRRADEAARAARCGDLDILIGYDLRFWRELGALVGNTYITDFLHRLRVQCWVFAVPYLRSDVDVRDWLWNGHPDLVAAITLGEHDAVRAVIDDYNAHALMWADRLAAGDPAHPGHGGKPTAP
ncbi:MULTISPECIES: GntR family transcriptional regulator [unclassified Streptomyces]|uniref:GntR family transcriptional regulator n=1 Tax=unclassified Streptomyces TaxID=2593676 RepID=UPI002DD7FCEC|nr:MULTISPECIES: GntR family transcriptional regulator [unclassified Streptomyces]WSF85411.1 GntR family transcriptional regulator [Streptomyces sp. NBC_01744]WSC38303.1 GntR family transcriptional regulator [Streptomyces sp. NBC_01763]WSC46421.1 GntR family transcriptional regulator [Streptomyces sp. NBC_01762]WSC54575.1 GntR family transcriptional regulator [Streptomyces sp. NBC_01761]WSD26074.1 GntR family transcriptional regulator [Streptomyces sp. NBC_01751]